MDRIKRHTKRTIIGIVGGIVTLIGVVLIPYPGPGWLIVFAGFAILATEFEFARKALHGLRMRYDAWTDWLKQQPWYIQLIALAFTGLVVLATVYLLNGIGLAAQLLGIEQDWLVSPFFR